MQVLLAAGADKEAKDKTGSTALMHVSTRFDAHNEFQCSSPKCTLTTTELQMRLFLYSRALGIFFHFFIHTIDFPNTIQFLQVSS